MRATRGVAHNLIADSCALALGDKPGAEAHIEAPGGVPAARDSDVEAHGGVP